MQDCRKCRNTKTISLANESAYSVGAAVAGEGAIAAGIAAALPAVAVIATISLVVGGACALAGAVNDKYCVNPPQAPCNQAAGSSG